MSHERSIDVLLLDILDDFERLLKTAKNGPAKKRLANRIERIKRATAQLALADDDPPVRPGRSGISPYAGP